MTAELRNEFFAQSTREVEPRGLEPLTPCLQSRCATNCAKAPQPEIPAGRSRRRRPNRVGGLVPLGLAGLTLVQLLLGNNSPDSSDRDQYELLHDTLPRAYVG